MKKVPQLFEDIAKFHKKFGLAATSDPDHRLPDDLLQFRIRFILEELVEYAHSVGFTLLMRDGPINIVEVNQSNETKRFDAEKAFDALVDIVYVALGTAYLHRFPFNRGWSRVQAANMKKVRAEGPKDPRSTRGHSADVVKPKGWVPPVLVDLLDEVCPACGGIGKYVTPLFADECRNCRGTGRKKRGNVRKAIAKRP